MTRVQITLTGSKAESFEDRKARLEEQLGYEMSNAQAVMLLMSSAVECDTPINLHSV